MSLPMHRKYSFVGGLALGLALLAAAAFAAEYSGASSAGLLSTEASGNLPSSRVRTAENSGASSGEKASSEEPRKHLKNEPDRERKGQHEKAETKSGAPKPAKKASPESAAPAPPQPQKTPVPAIDPDVNRAAGKLIIMRFIGGESSDAGPKAIRSLIHDGLIAGVMLGGENIQSKSQVKELIKFFSQGAGTPKPLFAISEIGGAGGAFPRTNEFEAWPSQREVASKGDPDYAYLTYRSLGSFLAGLGFNLNFGPKLGTLHAAQDTSTSFGDSPLQAGVFAKTFILGHRDGDTITVPVVDDSDVAVRALKTLLVSYPVMPIAVILTSDAQPLAAYDALVRGPRFCLVTLKQGSDPAEAASPFSRGCDALVIDGGKENPGGIRDLVVRGVSDAVKNGSLNLAGLNASAQKLSVLRSPSAPAGFTTRTAQ